MPCLQCNGPSHRTSDQTYESGPVAYVKQTYDQLPSSYSVSYDSSTGRATLVATGIAATVVAPPGPCDKLSRKRKKKCETYCKVGFLWAVEIKSRSFVVSYVLVSHHVFFCKPSRPWGCVPYMRCKRTVTQKWCYLCPRLILFYIVLDKLSQINLFGVFNIHLENNNITHITGLAKVV